MPWARGRLAFMMHGYGWSETWFTETSDLTLAEVFTRLKDLAEKRAELLCEEGKITYISTSMEDVTGDSRIGPFQDTPYTGTPGVHSEDPFTALLVRRRPSTNVAWSNLYLRGIPDDIVVEGGKLTLPANIEGTTTPSPAANWNKKFNQFATKVKDGRWGFLGKNRTTSTKALVQTLVQDDQGRPLITTGANQNPLAGATLFTEAELSTVQRVTISGVQGAASVNGTHAVLVTGPNVFRFVNRMPMFPYTTGGRVTVNRLTLHFVEAMVPQRIVSRRPGRPLYHSVGRRKGRKLT